MKKITIFQNNLKILIKRSTKAELQQVSRYFFSDSISFPEILLITKLEIEKTKIT